MMNFKRTIECCICGKTFTEKTQGEGFEGWGAIGGVKVADQENPALCPDHLAKVMDAVEAIISEEKS
jgi:hypothetical protein